MTARPLDSIPLTTEQMTWMEAYQQARQTVRWTTHTCRDDATSSMSMRWPRMVGAYAGWQLVEEPEPPSCWERLKARFCWCRV